MLFYTPTRSREAILSSFLLLAICFGSFTHHATAEIPRIVLEGAPCLGESVKEFKHVFHEAHCRRQRSGEVDPHVLKREWNRWIVCAVEKAVFPNGQPIAASKDDHLPVVLSATFLDKKLVSFDYMVGPECLDDLLRSFVSRYGPPDSAVRHLPAESRYASWTRGNSRLEIEQLVIYGRIDSSGALRIEKKPITTGVRVRISVNNPELSGELEEQDNPGDFILSQ